MNANDPPPADKSPYLPEYCQFHKPLLVEHFSLVPSPLELHYGKCSLIGRTSRDEATRSVYLDSTRLIGLDREFQCPDGSTRVMMHTAAGSHTELPVNETVRVFGEAGFFDTQSDRFQLVLITSLDLNQMHSVRKHELQAQESPKLSTAEVNQQLCVELEAMRCRYVPCLSVHTFSVIDQPHELLQMELKMLTVHASRKQTRQSKPWYN